MANTMRRPATTPSMVSRGAPMVHAQRCDPCLPSLTRESVLAPILRGHGGLPTGFGPAQVGPRARAARLSAVATQAAPSTSTAAKGVAAADASLTAPCRLVVPYHPTSHGQQLVLVGGCETLGNWDVKKGIKFKWSEGHSHVAELELPIHTNIACKLVVLHEGGHAEWEPEVNRELMLAPSSMAGRVAGFTVVAHWGFPDCSQILANSLRRSVSAGKAVPAPTSSGNSAGNALIAGVKKALAHASSRGLDRSSVIPGIVAGWEDELAALDEEAALVQCQINVLVPKGGPKLAPEQSLVLVGASAALGRWDPSAGVQLERVGEDSPLWTAQAELPLGEGLTAKVVIFDTETGKALTWEPCENRALPKLRGERPVLVTSYWGIAPTHCLEVDRLSVTTGSNPQVVQLLRQQLAATSSQLDGLRRERDHAVKTTEEVKQHSDDVKLSADKGSGRFEMVQLAEQLQTTRRLYEHTKKEAAELGGAVGVTRQLCDVAKRELSMLAKQLDSAKRAYESLAPEVERMEKRLSSTSRAFDATKPELAALEAQLERARGLFDRTLQQIEAAKSLAGSGDYDAAAVRRRSEQRVREMQYAKFN